MRMARSPFTITPFFPTSSRQFGRGGITVFRGSPIPHVQYGRGFGSLFKSMGRMVTPLIGKAVRYAGKTGLETGIGLLSDVLSGENVKTQKRCLGGSEKKKKARTLYYYYYYYEHWKKKKKKRKKAEGWTHCGSPTETTPDRRYFWIKQRHEGPVIHSHPRCDRVKIVFFCCSHGIRTTPETLRLDPRGELGFGTVSNPSHRHVDFKCKMATLLPRIKNPTWQSHRIQH